MTERRDESNVPVHYDEDDRYDPDLPEEWELGAPWLGNPWHFDVECANCGHEFENTVGICPMCDHDEVICP